MGFFVKLEEDLFLRNSLSSDEMLGFLLPQVDNNCAIVGQEIADDGSIGVLLDFQKFFSQTLAKGNSLFLASMAKDIGNLLFPGS